MVVSTVTGHAVAANAQQHVWSVNLGGAAVAATALGTAVAADGQGNAFCSGYFERTVDLGGGPVTAAAGSDAFVGKYRGSDGSYVWARVVGGLGDEHANSVATDGAGGVVLAGSFQSSVDFGSGQQVASAGSADGFVAKYADRNGAYLWSRTFGSTGSDAATAIATDANGDVLVTGYFNGTIGLDGVVIEGAGKTDAFVAKFAGADGQLLWLAAFGSLGRDQGTAVGVDDSGDVFATGEYEGTVTFGTTQITTAGSRDVFLVRLDGKNGSPAWVKSYGGESEDVSTGIAVDANGGIAITGYFFATIDFGGGPLVNTNGGDIFLARVATRDGSFLWAQSFGTNLFAGDLATGVAADSTGNLTLTGSIAGAVDFGGGPLPGDGNYDVFLARFSNAGEPIWSQRFISIASGQANGIATDSSGAVIATGFFSHSLDFGGGPLVNTGGIDAFIVKLAPPAIVATPTPTPTPTMTFQPSVTNTAARTSTPTATPPPTYTHTPTTTPTATRTSTPTSSPTRTLTPTATPTPTSTPTTTPTSSPTVTPTATSVVISGTVRYHATGAPIGGVGIDLSTDPPFTPTTTTTSGTGAFSGAVAGGQNWLVQPHLTGNLHSAINTQDAAYVLKILVGKDSPNPIQQLSCDVTRNGAVDMFDAVRILQFVQNPAASPLPAASACGSDWVFLPNPAAVPGQRVIEPTSGAGDCIAGGIAYEPLSGNAGDQDFLAAPYGDCSPDWQ